MLRGLWRLTWLEIKIFVREPLGVVGTIGVPVLVFVVIGRIVGPNVATAEPEAPAFVAADLPIFASMLIVLSAVMSLITIISIYREGGILKRLRATPLRPHTILTAHVVVKLLMTAITLTLMVAAGRRFYPIGPNVPLVAFGAALLVSTFSILSIGFLIASVVPTARFAQPFGTLVLYPMLGVSGLFVPFESLPAGVRYVASVLPTTHAVALLRGIWRGEGWAAHATDVGALLLLFVVYTAVSSRVFRWD